MTQTSNLTVKAGTRAIEFLRDEGFEAERIHVLAGASGGPKWLVLSGMDLYHYGATFRIVALHMMMGIGATYTLPG